MVIVHLKSLMILSPPILVLMFRTANEIGFRDWLEKMAGVQTPPVSPRPRQPLNFVPEPATTIEPTRVISEWAREKGRESYQAMKHAARHGYACIMEKCYVLIGCRPDEHALLLGPLQQLVNTERKVTRMLSWSGSSSI